MWGPSLKRQTIPYHFKLGCSRSRSAYGVARVRPGIERPELRTLQVKQTAEVPSLRQASCCFLAIRTT